MLTVFYSHVLQYSFCCNEEEGLTQIGSTLPVDDGQVKVVNIRYYSLVLVCCLVILKKEKLMSNLYF